MEKPVWWTPMAAGALASLGSDSIMHPVDVVRVRIQASALTSPRVAHEVTKLVQREGLLALYKGYASVAVLSAPANAAFFMAYDYGSQQGLSAVPQTLLATVASTMVYAPMEVVKERVMVQTGLSSRQVLLSIIRERGGWELYRGAGASYTTWAPYLVLYYAAYEQLKAGPLAWAHPEQAGGPGQLVCAIGAGGLAAAVTCPLDVLKTRMQLGGMRLQAGHAAGEPGSSVARPLGYMSVVSGIWRQEGGRGFLRGLGARLFWLAPASAINITLYEIASRRLGRGGL